MLYNALRNIDNEAPNKLAWTSLLEHESWNDEAPNNWRPFDNGLCAMLFLGYVNPELHLTRNVLNWFLAVLHSLQQQGVIKNNYWIPADGTTIERWKRFFPVPPTSVSILAPEQHFCVFAQEFLCKNAELS